MKIGIIGPTGFSGSHTAIELLNRGHNVVGFSRTPEKLGKHANYSPITLAVENAAIADLINAFSGLDVLINAYNPSPGPGVYKTFLETTRRILLATKHLTAQQNASNNNLYFISIGGTASLFLPSPTPHTTAGDSRPFWLAYRRANASSNATIDHLKHRLGSADHPMVIGMQTYRAALLAVREGSATEEQRSTLKEIEDPVLHGPQDAAPSELPLAARAAFMMFESVPRSAMMWSFVSPPARFRPGPRTGRYDVWVDELPLAEKQTDGRGRMEEGNEFDGRLLGVSAADLAVAIADEVEKKALVGKHWSPVSEWEGDGVFETYVRLS